MVGLVAALLDPPYQHRLCRVGRGAQRRGPPFLLQLSGFDRAGEGPNHVASLAQYGPAAGLGGWGLRLRERQSGGQAEFRGQALAAEPPTQWSTGPMTPAARGADCTGLWPVRPSDSS